MKFKGKLKKGNEGLSKGPSLRCGYSQGVGAPASVPDVTLPRDLLRVSTSGSGHSQQVREGSACSSKMQCGLGLGCVCELCPGADGS